MSEYLEPWELAAVHYIERIHSTRGVVPKDSDLDEHLRLTKGFTKFNINSLKTNPLFLKSMEARGININTGDGELSKVVGLNQRQMEAVATMTNIVDRRSDEKKLRDLGITTDEWTNWLQDQEFSNYYNQRVELLIQNSIGESHLGLLRGVRQGNVNSIRLHYELTGRHNPQENTTLDVKLMMVKVLEIIVRHVKDPETLNRISLEMAQVNNEVTGGGSFPPVVKGEALPELKENYFG